MIYCLFDAIYLSVATTMIYDKVWSGYWSGSGSVINWSQGSVSVIQDNGIQGSRSGSERNIYGYATPGRKTFKSPACGSVCVSADSSRIVGFWGGDVTVTVWPWCEFPLCTTINRALQKSASPQISSPQTTFFVTLVDSLSFYQVSIEWFIEEQAFLWLYIWFGSSPTPPLILPSSRCLS